MTDKSDDRKTPRSRRIIRLDDLAPTRDVLGGRKLVFGQGVMGERGAVAADGAADSDTDRDDEPRH